MTHKEKILAELETIYDHDFKVPPGLYIPLGARVLVKECSQEEHRTQGGIIISSGNLQHAKIGIVYRIGDGVTLPIKIGMKVAFDKTAYMGIVHKSVTYIDLMEHQIYSAVPPENYLDIHVADNDEKRRQVRIDATKNSIAKSDRQMDQINYGDGPIKI